jgi:hypothetical protein
MLSLDGVHAVIVGLDSFGRLDEDAGVATGFRPTKGLPALNCIATLLAALADVVAPWDEPGYVDGR